MRTTFIAVVTYHGFFLPLSRVKIKAGKIYYWEKAYALFVYW